MLRVTSIHIPLLKRWAELLEDPRYQHWQTQDFSQRPIHCWSDQDALTALLGSQEFEHVNVRILKTGRNVIHCLSYTSFPVRARQEITFTTDDIIEDGSYSSILREIAKA